MIDLGHLERTFHLNVGTGASTAPSTPRQDYGTWPGHRFFDSTRSHGGRSGSASSILRHPLNGPGSHLSNLAHSTSSRVLIVDDDISREKYETLAREHYFLMRDNVRQRLRVEDLQAELAQVKRDLESQRDSEMDNSLSYSLGPPSRAARPVNEHMRNNKGEISVKRVHESLPPEERYNFDLPEQDQPHVVAIYETLCLLHNPTWSATAATENVRSFIRKGVQRLKWKTEAAEACKQEVMRSRRLRQKYNCYKTALDDIESKLKDQIRKKEFESGGNTLDEQARKTINYNGWTEKHISKYRRAIEIPEMISSDEELEVDARGKHGEATREKQLHVKILAFESQELKYVKNRLKNHYSKMELGTNEDGLKLRHIPLPMKKETVCNRSTRQSPLDLLDSRKDMWMVKSAEDWN